MKEKMLLIDGSSLIFRAFFAIRHLTTKDGIYTNGVYGFLTMYRKALELVEPDYIVVAFDKSGPTFRNEDYKAYKANREKTPSELSAQFGMLKDVLDAMNVVHIDMDQFEADDILGTIAKKASNESIDTYLLTGDKDYFQLVDEHTSVLYTKKGISNLEEYDLDKIKERYEVTPKDLIQVKGLMGDKSDNIPGVPGIGEKTAIKLIKEYKTIENVYDNLDKLPGKKLKENLENYKMDAFMSRKLGEIYLDVPLDYKLSDFEKKDINEDKLYEKFQLLEFNTLMEELAPKKDMKIINYKAKFLEKESYEKLLSRIEGIDKIYINFLSDNELYIHSQPIYVAFKLAGEDIVYIIDLKDIEEEGLNFISYVLSRESIKKIGFDVKKDMFLSNKLGLSYCDNYKDLMIMEYLIDPSRTSYSVSDLSSKYLGRHIKNEEDYLGKGKSKKNFQDLDKSDLENYLSSYLHVLNDIENSLDREIEEKDMKGLYYSMENPLVKVLSHMEIVGIKTDRLVLEEIDKDITSKLKELEGTIHRLSGQDFNINSPKQLGEVLFDKMGLPVIKRTKTGYSTNAEVLDKLKGEHEIIDYILDYRSLKKLKGTYIDGMYPHIQDDQRIRTTFKQNITTTGRISSTEPNLQNIPIRTEEGRKIRKAFVADEGKIFIAADYSQIELRVLAALSKDSNMLDAFIEGIDIHTKTAAEVFHVDLDDVTPNQRSDAKAVNFGIVYGISNYGLSRDLDIPRDIAKDYIDKYLESYPDIKSYMDNIVIDAKKKGYVETIFHRRRYIPELHSSNFNIRSFGERIALNTPIQGSAADIIKLAMVKVFNRLRNESLESKIVLQIHDELILEVPLNEKETIEKILKEEMENAVVMDVDLKVDINEGVSWYEA